MKSLEEIREEIRYILQRERTILSVDGRELYQVDDFDFCRDFTRGQEVVDPVTGVKGVIIGYARRTYQV